MENDFLFRVTDLKQLLYCPRIPFFDYVAQVPKRPTAKMELGKEQHAVIEGLEERRVLKRYGLEDGQREFRVRLTSYRLGLTGILDMLITTSAGLFPVEFKFSSGKPATHHKYQLAAYALLVEDQRGQPIRQGFLYFHPARSIFPVLFTQSVKEYAKRGIRELSMLVEKGACPDPPRRRERCRECEYHLYCGDL
jgi:CRISPR-associated exonuclease Cas4